MARICLVLASFSILRLTDMFFLYLPLFTAIHPTSLRPSKSLPLPARFICPSFPPCDGPT